MIFFLLRRPLARFNFFERPGRSRLVGMRMLRMLDVTAQQKFQSAVPKRNAASQSVYFLLGQTNSGITVIAHQSAAHVADPGMMSAAGQTRSFNKIIASSGLPPKPDFTADI
jgi:hypothetical protein